MIIPYFASNFGPSWGARLHNGPHTAKNRIHADRIDLAWAAFTAGKPDAFSLATHGRSSFLDALAQVCTVLSITDQDKNFIVKSSLQLAQEKTELAYSSNKTGNAIAKLVSAQLFGVDWLIHTSMFSHKMGLKFWKSRSPDFIGLTKDREWVIVEAKGTSGPFCQSTITDGKAQTRSLRQINGKHPVLRVVTLSHYWGDMLCGAIEDPDEYDQDAIDLEFNVEEVIQSFYKSLTPPHITPHEIELLGRKYLLYKQAVPDFDLALPAHPTLAHGESPTDRPWRQRINGYMMYPDGICMRKSVRNG